MQIDTNTKILDYDSPTKTFTVDASELGIAAGDIPMIITVESARTGNHEDFNLEYISELGTLEYIPACEELAQTGISMMVFNNQEKNNGNFFVANYTLFCGTKLGEKMRDLLQIIKSDLPWYGVAVLFGAAWWMFYVSPADEAKYEILECMGNDRARASYDACVEKLRD